MANVIVALDGDPVRRASFLERARTRIAPMPGLAVEHREGDGWGVVWAASASAPVSAVSDGIAGTMVWGDAIDPTGHRLGAADVARRWRDDESTFWDGFHLAIDLPGDGRLTASVDLLGLLPLYHWRGGDVALVGTSVDVFRSHPSFRADLDPTGLIGILLMNGQVGGRTLWTGVRRLGVRKQLRVRRGHVEEIETLALPETDRALLGLPVEGHVEILGDVLDQAMRRQVHPAEPHGLLLSGGMDSRQIGGLLADRGVRVEALTFGVDGDIEMRCAKRIAKALGAPHQAVEIPVAAYLAAADRLLAVEGLAAGFSNVLDWGMVPFLDRLPPRVALGHVFDGVVGGIHIPWAFDAKRGAFSFETIFRRFNRWGFSPDLLRETLIPALHPQVDEVVESVRDTYESASNLPNLKAWHFDLLTRQRFHVGAAVWPMSFRSWPVSPIFDREVLRTTASMPASSIGDRRLQQELLVARHPHLAAIALDRNSFDNLPVQPRLRDHLRVATADKWRHLLDRMPIGRWRQERRFYYRTYDFASPGWLGIRRAAEEHRSSVPGALRPEAVARLWPRPDQALRTGDRIIDSSNAKILVGLAMAGRHFGLT